MGSRLLLALTVAVVVWMGVSMLRGRTLPVGAVAPDFSLPRAGASGERLSLADLRGQAVVVEFFSATCPPCLREIDELKVVWRRYRTRGVTVLGVSAGSESAHEIARFVRDRDVDYPVVVDDGSAADAYGVRTLPTVYVIDGQGRVAFASAGFAPFDDIARVVDEALADRGDRTR